MLARIETYQKSIINQFYRGKYSEVYTGIDIYNQRVVMKFLKPVREEKLNREIKIMRDLSEGPNILHLVDVVRDEATKSPVLITEFVGNHVSI